MLGGRLGPGARVFALHLRPVATRASDVLGWIREARVAVEAPSRSQADEDLAWAPLEPSLDLDRVVARVEDEQGTPPSSSRPSKASTCSVATTLASWAGRTRSTSTGAVQLSRAKLSCAIHW